MAIDRQIFSNEEVLDDDTEYTPLLHMAVALNSQEIANALLNNGADPDVLDEDGWTPLQVAAAIKHSPAMVETLLKHGANINTKNKEGNTALHLVVEVGNFNIVQILIENGADPSIKNNKGDNPLHMVANYSSNITICTKDIKGNNLPISTVTKSQISNQSNDESRESSHIPINIKDLAKIQLSGAVKGYSNKVKIIETLLKHDINKESKKALVNQRNHKGNCPIHLAVQNNDLDAAEVLLMDSRTDVNATTGTSMKTALMLVVEGNDHDMVKLLLNNDNIDHNIKDGADNTALQLALIHSNCSDDIVAALWQDIEERIRNGTLKNYVISLEQDSQIEEKLDRIRQKYQKYNVDLKSVIKFTQLIYEFSSSEESESEESDIDEVQPEQEISEPEVEEAGPSAKRARLG